MKEYLIRLCPKQLYNLYGDVKFWIRFHFFRKGLISEEFKGLLGYEMDWDNPKDLNQKINWMKINYDTSEWSKLADKLAVRDYVIERIGEKYLPTVYCIWESASQMDFDTLPDRFVLKTNHGCATVQVILDKSIIDIIKTKKQVEAWLGKKFGYSTIEPHYLSIRPLIYAEELLINDSTFSSTLVDYKIYCFDGEPFCILVCTNREIKKGKTHANYSYYDKDWNPRPDVLAGHLKGNHIDCPKPKCLEELLHCARALSKGHPQVRVDFYIVNDQPVFGEMTFTSNGGYDTDITREFSLEMGNKIDII